MVVEAGTEVVVVPGGSVVVVVGTVEVDAAVEVDADVELDDGMVAVDLVVDPVVVGSGATVSAAGEEEASATPTAARAEPTRVPIDSGTTSMVVSRRRGRDTGNIS